jgi:hypothetical protein
MGTVWKKKSFFINDQIKKWTKIYLHRFANYAGLKTMNRFKLERIQKMNDFENGNNFVSWTSMENEQT